MLHLSSHEVNLRDVIVYGVMIDGAALEHDDTRYFYPIHIAIIISLLGGLNGHYIVMGGFTLPLCKRTAKEQG